MAICGASRLDRLFNCGGVELITKPTTYTTEFVLAELKDMLHRVETDEDVLFIGELFAPKPYTRQRFSEWATKFEGKCKEISDTIKKIEETLESRLAKHGLTGALNTPMTIFTLKTKHGWQETQKVEMDVTSKGDKLNQESNGLFSQFVKSRLGGRRHLEVGTGEPDQKRARRHS